MKIKISFVILSYNDGEMVINAIRSIKSLKTKYSYDIFVVDNGSESGTAKIIKEKFKDVKLIELKKNNHSLNPNELEKSTIIWYLLM